MKLTLVRHGEMCGDPFICPERPVSGCLSEEMGVLQAKETGEALKNMKFDYAFSSPYGRALQTAETVLANRDIDIQILEFMHEWMPNRELENVPSTVAEEIYKQNAAAYAEESWKNELGEGYFEMCSRIIPPFLKALDKLGIHSRMGGFVPEENAKDLSIVVFAHGGSLGILTGFLLGVRPFPVGSFNYEHTGVAFFDFTQRNGIYYPQLVIRALHPLGRE
jgi:broad specificity phosphatase PhoE